LLVRDLDFECFGCANSLSISACGTKTALPTLTTRRRPRWIQLLSVRGARPNISAISAVDSIRGNSRAVCVSAGATAEGTGAFDPSSSCFVKTDGNGMVRFIPHRALGPMRPVCVLIPHR
jgi:hypothetical protein